MKCPCHSGLDYIECCSPYHLGKEVPESALQLMRSRYSAYALHKPHYIIETTHPENLAYTSDTEEWEKSILHFTKKTDFLGLKIHQFVEGTSEAFVTFYAHLHQGTQDVSIEETSRFLKHDGRWYYHSGTVESIPK
jgi:SEC-C motif domain protein